MTATGLGSSPEMLLLGQRDGKLSLSSIPLLSGESGSEPCSAPTERCLLRIAVAIAVNQKRALTRSAASRPYGVIRIISASPSCCFLPPEPPFSVCTFGHHNTPTLFEGEPLSMPPLCSATKDGDIP